MVRPRTVIVTLVVGLCAALWWGRPTARANAPLPRVTAAERVTAAPRARVTPPVAAAPAPAPAKPGPVFAASWGGGPDQLGRDRPPEGSPVGPMSFAVDPKGGLLVLDNVNDRLVRRNADGSANTLIPVGGYPEDVAWADDGSMAVLDRFRDRSVSLFDASGRPLGKLPLEGPGVPDTGSITSIAVDGNDVYAERAHGPMVKLGSLSGVPAADRSEIPGRPSRDGTAFLASGIIEAASGRAYVTVTDRAPLQHRFTRELRLEAPVRQILLLDSDRAGTIYFAAEVQPGQSETQTEIKIVCLEPLGGAPTGTASVAANTLPEESFRDLAALPDGGVLVAHRTEQGVTYTRVECE